MRSNLIPALMPYDPYKDWLLALDFANLVNSPNGKPTFKTPYGIYDKFSSIPGASFSAGAIIFYNPITGLWNFRAANDDTPMQGVGLDIAEGTTNKCTNYNAAPTVLIAPTTLAAYNTAAAGTSSAAGGDASTLFGVVDDTAALQASGFGPLIDVGRMNGRAFVCDNRAGAATAYLMWAGNNGNTNTHAVSVFGRGGGTYGVALRNSSSGGSDGGATNLSAPTSTYSRGAHITSTAVGTNRWAGISVPAGAIGYFILNQLEEKAYATNPVIVAGASASRGAATPVVTGLASLLTPPFTLVAVANLSAIDGTNRDLLTASDGTDANKIAMRRSSLNSARVLGVLGASVTNTDLATGYAGPRLLKMAVRVRSGPIGAGSADGKTPVTVNGTPDPALLTRLTLGATATASSNWPNSPLLFAGIAPDLTDAQLQALTASNGLLTDFL